MKEKEININNYEAWLLDYAEGNLPKDKIELLFSFMESHPEFKDDYEMVFDLDFLDKILPENSLKLENSEKENLKVKPKGKIDSNNFEDFIISDIEGLLNEEEKQELSAFLAENPMAQKEQLLFDKTVLQPDLTEQYPNKAGLKKAAPIFFLSSNNYAQFAVAASILLLIGFFFFYNSPENKKLELAEIKTEEPKLDTIISKEIKNSPKPSSESTSDSEEELIPQKPENNSNENQAKPEGVNNDDEPIRSRILKLKIKENPSHLYFQYQDQQIAYIDIEPEIIPSTDYFFGEEVAEAKPKTNDFKSINEVLGNEIDKRVFNSDETPQEGRFVAAANKLLGKFLDSEIVVTHDTISNRNELAGFYSPLFEIERKK